MPGCAEFSSQGDVIDLCIVPPVDGQAIREYDAIKPRPCDEIVQFFTIDGAIGFDR
jgi:hypothetical protein